MTALALSDLTIERGGFALEGLRLALEPGKLHLLLGPTGAGKTLLLETIVGLLRPRKGRILFCGREITDLPPERRDFGYVPQDLALFPHLSVRGNIEYGLRMRGARGSEEARARVARLVSTMGIAHLLERRTEGLSGGERQRVALARALAPNPALLLLDEPFSAVHPRLRWDLHELLRDVHDRLGLTVLMVTHDWEDAFSIGERAAILIDGALHQADGMKALFDRPPTLEVARFFGVRNIFEGVIETVERDEVRIAAQGFGTLRVAEPRPERRRPGERVRFGVHAEDVTVVKPGRDWRERPNRFSGRIARIRERGRFYEALFESPGRPPLIVGFSAAAQGKLGVSEGWEGDVEIRRDRIFLLPPGRAAARAEPLPAVPALRGS